MVTVTKPVQLTFITDNDIGEYTFQFHFEDPTNYPIARVVTGSSYATELGSEIGIDRKGNATARLIFESNVFIDLYNIRESDIDCYSIKPYIMDPNFGSVNEEKKLIHILIGFDKTKRKGEAASSNETGIKTEEAAD